MSQGVQSRVFDYDGRGLLTSERHPELGNGATFYCNYDSRGNVHRKVEGVAASGNLAPHGELVLRIPSSVWRPVVAEKP